MTTLFFVAEITTGYITHSVALIADSFHMLSDVISLIVGFIAVRVSVCVACVGHSGILKNIFELNGIVGWLT